MFGMPMQVDADSEQRCREGLHALLTSWGAHDVERNVEQLMALDGGFVDRFNYVAKHLQPRHRRRLLVSGCAVGSEMIVARRYGFEFVAGLEVGREYVELARQRLSTDAGYQVEWYDGAKLPFATGQMSAVVSGHIIEHTPSPRAYLLEHLRVLEPGGLLFLEFPDRYHSRELHTELPSVEYLPLPLRNAALRLLSSRLSPFPPASRARYADILRTLQPVSTWQVRLWLLGAPGARIAHVYHPLPGYTRMIILR